MTPIYYSLKILFNNKGHILLKLIFLLFFNYSPLKYNDIIVIWLLNFDFRYSDSKHLSSTYTSI